MSVSRKVLRRMKKVMGVIGAVPVLTACSSQISCAKVKVRFDSSTGTLYFSGNGVIDGSWKERYTPESIRRVVIDNGIRGISEKAFYRCGSLEGITIPNSVTSIGSYAFYCCTFLEEIKIPNSVTSIDSYAFGCCKFLDEIEIPNSVTSIGSAAFFSCESLTKIKIPNSVKTIAACAFVGCSSLKEIKIPNSVTSIGSYAFSGCRSLGGITIPNSVNIIDDSAFGCCKKLKTVKFEDMSRRDSNSCWDVLLRKHAFDGCKQLGILDLGHDTNSRNAKVESGAFFGCDPNFVALEGRTVRGKFYSTVYYYNYFIPHAFLVDSMNDRINKKNSFFKKG